MNKAAFLPRLLCLTCWLVALPCAVRSVTQTYDDASIANVWDTSTFNWDGSTAAWTDGNDAVFGGTGEAISVSAVSVRNVDINSAGYSFTGGTLTFTGVTATFTAAQDITVSSTLAGSAGLVKAGAGLLVFSSANTGLSGGVTLNAGVLSADHDNALGTGALTLSGGLLRSSSGNRILANSVVVTAATSTSILDNTGSGDFILAGAVTGGGSLSINSTLSRSFWFQGDGSAFAGTVNYVNNNNGTNFRLGGTGVGGNALTNASDWSGTTFVLSGATGNNRGVSWNGLAGTTVRLGALSGTGRVGNVLTGNAAVWEIGALNTSTTYSGLIEGTSTALRKVGSGTLTLSGVNTYTGGTVVNGGTLQLNAGAWGTGVIRGTATVNNGAVLELGVSGSNVHPMTWTDTVNINGGGTLTVSNGGGLAYDVAQYFGTLNLDSGNGNAALVTAAAGTGFRFRGSANSAINSTGPVANTVSSNLWLVNDGVPGTSRLSADTGNTLVLSGILADYPGLGGTTLIKNGAGTVLLSGNNSYGGNTVVNAGTVKLGHMSALGTRQGTRPVTQVVVNSGGAVDFNGVFDATYGYTIAGTGVGGTGALVNAGAGIGNNYAQASNIKLSADATVGGTGNWSLLTGSYAATTLDLNGFTLTKAGANTVHLVSTTTTAGTVEVSAGTLQLGVSNGGTGVNGSASTFRVSGGTLHVHKSSTMAAAVMNGGTLRTEQNLSNPIILNSTANTITPSGAYRVLSGQLSGAGGFTVGNAGGTDGLALSNPANNFSGNVTINGGNTFLRLDASEVLPDTATVTVNGNLRMDVPGGGVETIAGLSGNGAVWVPTTNNAMHTLAVGAGDTTSSFSGEIGPAGQNNAFLGLAKTGSGTLTLSGTNQYAGGTSVQQGTLRINGTHTGAGPISVSAGATLGGTGTMVSVDIAAGGILAPGGSAGTIRIGTLALTASSILAFELGDPSLPSASDRVVVTSWLDDFGGLLNVSALPGIGAPLPGASWLVMEYPAVSGSLNSGTTLALGTNTTGLALELDVSTPSQVLLVVVPEPAAAGLFLLGVLFLRTLRKRRQ